MITILLLIILNIACLISLCLYKPKNQRNAEILHEQTIFSISNKEDSLKSF